ncbi:MAG: MgtC/SapB family protein [Candidatus Ratteibacteria bacterium]|jgi:putative Mg2+ transporter-C (MgtC) family protein
MITSEWEWILRLIIAAVLGGVVGLERESRGREAGFRTLILVCSGTCLIMITSLRVPELFACFTADSVLRLDPARIAYGTITGIGFLGAGAIVRDKKRTRGITTAACLWVVAAIGLAIGCGFYYLGVASTAISILVLYFLRLAEKFIPKDNYNSILITRDGEREMTPLLQVLDEFQMKMLSQTIKVQTPPPVTEIEFSVRHKNHTAAEIIVNRFLSVPGVKMVEWK